MKLQAYIERFPEIDLQDFAKGLGISRKTLWNALEGQNVNLEIAVKIQTGTAGIVRCEDLLKEKNQNAQHKKEKQQQQNHASLDTPLGTSNAS